MAGDLQYYCYTILVSILFVQLSFSAVFFNTKPTKRLHPGPRPSPSSATSISSSPTSTRPSTSSPPSMAPSSISALVPSQPSSPPSPTPPEKSPGPTSPASPPDPSPPPSATLPTAPPTSYLPPYRPYWKFMKALHVGAPGSRTLEQMHPIRREEVRSLLRLLLSRSEKHEAVTGPKELITMASRTIPRMEMSRTWSDNEREAKEVQKVVYEVLLLTGTFKLPDYFGVFRNLDLQGLTKRFVQWRCMGSWMR